MTSAWMCHSTLTTSTPIWRGPGNKDVEVNCSSAGNGGAQGLRPAIPKLNKMQVLELARCDWIERRENVIALGPPAARARRMWRSVSAWPHAKRACP